MLLQIASLDPNGDGILFFIFGILGMGLNIVQILNSKADDCHI